jgi:CBS domain-containing protein
MKISEVMSRDVQTVLPDDTVQKAAKMMGDLDVGVLPVCDGKNLLGMITDRDIAVRATSTGKSPQECRVRDTMSQGVDYCFDDEDVETVSRKMGERQIRRMPVINHDKHLVGIVALGDIATSSGERTSGETLRDVSESSKSGQRPH